MLAIKLSALASLSPFLVLVIVCVISSALSQVDILLINLFYVIYVHKLQVASNSTIVTIMVPVVFAVSETIGTNPLYLALGNRKLCDMKKTHFYYVVLKELPLLPAMPSCCLWAPPTMPLSMMLERYIMTKDIRDNVIYLFRKELT